MEIELPFPNLSLNPNNSSGKHWTALYGAKEDAKRTAFFLTKQIIGEMSMDARKQIPSWQDELSVTIRIVPPDGCRRDMDNIEAALKSSQDGIFTALGLDDGRIVEKRTVMIRIEDADMKKRGAIFYSLLAYGKD